MSGHIFNIQSDGTLIEMNEQPFANEDIFQKLLEDYPNLLAGDQINSVAPRRWLLIKREMGIPSKELGSNHWSLDHLFLDQDAIPTLVEIKRGTDPRIRREVVGQMLDYAANAVVYWSIEKLIAEFEKQCKLDQLDPTDRIQEFLAEDREPEEFWQTVKTNLQAGRVRLLFVADVIPPQLRRIVEFLNEQMDPAEVLAVEIKHYVGTGLKTLVPRIIGQTAEAESRKGASSGRSRKPLTEEELRQIAQDNGVGACYDALLSQMKPLFEETRTTLSNVAFYGKIAGFVSGAVIASLTPTRSSIDRGVAFGFYLDRMAEYFQLEKTAIIAALPESDEIQIQGWAGDVYRGYVKTPDELQSIISLMKDSDRTK